MWRDKNKEVTGTVAAKGLNICFNPVTKKWKVRHADNGALDKSN